MEKKEVIRRLQSDEDYYGKFGKKYLSASSVRNLLYSPTRFGKMDKSLPLIQGGYFHTLMLEPEKLETYHVLDVKTRNNKEFKGYTAENNLHQYDVLLSHEVETIHKWADKIKSNLELHEMIYDSRNRFEVPNITNIGGVEWKGKCDILGEDYVYDLKTSSNVHKFRWSCKEYCYDAQAYVYQTLFNKPMRFIVIDKSSLEVKIADCSEEFIESGREKVENAIKVYKKFFTDKGEGDLDSFIYRESL